MRLLSRTRYYAGRMRDAGVGATARKLRSLLMPYVWSPAYLLKLASGRVPQDSLARLDALGTHLCGGLRQYASSDSGFAGRAIDRARRASSGKWTVLGYGEVSIPAADGWAEDRVHGYRWPHRYFSFIDFVAADKHCDVKIPWELSRLQYLVWLAEGYLFDPAARDTFVPRYTAIVEDWIESNRPGFGVNWTSAMEVAIRGLNLMLSAAVLAEDLPARTRDLVIQSLADHYAFLRRFPELSDVPGNHYLTDLLGEVGLSVVVGEGGDFAHAIEAFIAEADRQFEPDGCHIERAPVYHRLCTDMVAMAAAFAARQTVTPPDRMLQILERSISFARFIADTHAILPVIGDCDSGQVLELALPARDASALLALADDHDGRNLPDQTVWWRAIAGNDGVKVSTSRPPRAGSRSGFLIARSGPCCVAMRVGAQGLGGRAPHDHDDAQSVWVSAEGRDLIVDRGCHSYTLDPAIRIADISSRAHNVLQPVAGPRFGGREGSINLTMRGASTCYFADAGVVDGNPRLTATIDRAGALSSITRVLDLRSTLSGFDLCVTDTWSCAETVELRWHLAPGLIPVIPRPGAVEFRQPASIRAIQFEGESLLELAVFNFDFSPVYGQKLPCFGVRAVLAPAPHGTLISRFQIGTAGKTGS
jgi:hypothetical protein